MRIHFNRILCTTDLSDYARQGIRYATALARTLNAELFLCSIIDPIPLVYAEGMRDPNGYERKMEKRAREKMAAAMADCHIPWKDIVRTGHPPTRITELAEELDADLVVVTTRPGSGLKKFFMGSTSEELIRTLKVPLLILRDVEPEALKTTPNGPILDLKRILIGYDFSYHATMALRYGLSLSQEFEAELHIVHTVSENQHKAFLAEGPPGDRIRHQKEEMKKLKEKLDSLVPDEARTWCHCETRILLGEAHTELRKYALANGIDVTLVGSRGISLAESMLMGSVTDRLIRENPCPVMSVH
ncbi:universal stress protein [Desulfobotulus sp. H1]|uniref:Universal stress protein n=1 Tax=Desulfobotulus pelophilus TaxID=2823377 RepID=A0ABT3N5C7_9BACT|nr:universal stress protein [Desulfobotulus pelophilus]MCW7752658.1 universal stress protein [Desulfobotulus pelophilus]